MVRERQIFSANEVNVGSLVKTVVLVIITAAIHGCASYTDETKEIRSLYRGGQYKSALEKVDSSSIKEQDRNRLLYFLERAMVLDRLGQVKQSQSLLFDADKLVDRLYTTSISKEALTYIYNDSAQDYPGEDFEKVAIHTQLAMSFIEAKKFKSARVEARKINSKLHEINDKYDGKKNRYSEDAFARYLAGAIYESRGEVDDAIIDYRKALKLYEGLYIKEFATSVPDQLVFALYRLLRQRRRQTQLDQLVKSYKRLLGKNKNKSIRQNHGEVVVFHEVGSVAVKEAKDFVIPFGKQVIRLSFPVIKPRIFRHEEQSVGVRTNGKAFHSELLQNMDQIASKTLDDRRLRLVLKQGARLLAKGQLTEQAHQQFGLFAGLAANVYSAVTETADTRSWTLMPAAYYATRFQLPAGEHTISIVTSRYGSHKKTKKINVSSGKLVLLRAKG